MFAVIKTGGKQYKVIPNQILKIEKLPYAVGEKFEFPEVLLFKTDQEIQIGEPRLKHVKVKAEVLEQGRHSKITVLKYKPKTRYRVKSGHRQPYTKVKILEIKA